MFHIEVQVPTFINALYTKDKYVHCTVLHDYTQGSFLAGNSDCRELKILKFCVFSTEMTSPNKNKSQKLWQVTSILVCCIFGVNQPHFHGDQSLKSCYKTTHYSQIHQITIHQFSIQNFKFFFVSSP